MAHIFHQCKKIAIRESDREPNIMSDSEPKSFLPLQNPMPPSDDEAKKSPVSVKDKGTIGRASTKTAASSDSTNTISPIPTNKNIMTSCGQLLTPAPGRLTPTSPGRIKAPPVCMAPSLKRAASSMGEFNTVGVCFSLKEADSCAEKALALDSGACVEKMPLNIEKHDNVNSTTGAQSMGMGGSKAQFVSSNSTVVTTSSASSCGRSIMGNEITGVSSVATRKGPPLEVVRTDLEVNSEEENASSNTTVRNPSNVSTAVMAKGLQLAVAPQRISSSTSLTAAFTDNLIKENSSRQGRSLQRWLIHSPTKELVRQVAGTIPITRDGRIVLVSASRKTEWILPKGGWDADETKEECAARETFEEAGLLGRLGGCLEPIDYETAKARKRRLGKQGSAVVGTDGKKASGKLKKSQREEEGMRPPLPKRVKMDKSMAPAPAGPNPTSSTMKEVGSSESTHISDADSGKTTAAYPSSTPAATASFDPKNYSYVRLFLFPLYVSSVKSDWPEKGRLRKLVDIDEAIKIMDLENRLYFKKGLEMVKERGLHLLKP